MCGIAGVINSGLDRGKLERILTGMQHQLHHRGPDDRGLFISCDGKTGLVNTRLAILDLSSAGHQPMVSADERYRIVLNGEIYNFQTLRAELEGKGETFRSHSDTEVVLKMYERYGPDSVRELEGMFALAIWDEQEQTCFLARDPLGIKPLYYYETNGASPLVITCFGSMEEYGLRSTGIFSLMTNPSPKRTRSSWCAMHCKNPSEGIW